MERATQQDCTAKGGGLIMGTKRNDPGETTLEDWQAASLAAREAQFAPAEWGRAVTIGDIVRAWGKNTGGSTVDNLNRAVKDGKLRAKKCRTRDGGKLSMRYSGNDVLRLQKEGVL